MYTVKLQISDRKARKLLADLLKKYPTDPTEPPADPIPAPVIVKPVPAGTTKRTFRDVWGKDLDSEIPPGDPAIVYGNAKLRVSKHALSISIPIPTITVPMQLKISRIEDTAQSGMAYGVISDRRDFTEPVYSKHTWGLGRGVAITLWPKDSGRILYFNMSMVQPQKNWRTTLQASLR